MPPPPTHPHHPPPTIILAAAAAKEAEAVAAAWPTIAVNLRDWTLAPMDDRFALLRTGVGKVNAAVAVAQVQGAQVVINLGICGALPDESGGFALNIGDVVVASTSVYGDEGLVTPDGFIPISAMGFAPGGGAFDGCAVNGDTRWIERVMGVVGASAHSGVIATVSTCSGTTIHAKEIAHRTGAIAEAMEGAAIGHALARLHGPKISFIEVRVVSNTTGDRKRQVWDLPLALDRLRDLSGKLRAGL